MKKKQQLETYLIDSMLIAFYVNGFCLSEAVSFLWLIPQMSVQYTACTLPFHEQLHVSGRRKTI